MTINGLSSYSSSLTAMTQSAGSGRSQITSDTSEGISINRSMKASRPPKPNEAALAKLQETDPSLAQKMEEFHQKIDQMKQDGASEDDVRSMMKENMDSLSDTEKSELKSIFGNPPSGGPPPPNSQDLLTSLKQSNPDLATKLEGFQKSIDSLKSSDATSEDIDLKWKELLSSLTETEKTDLKKAMDETRPKPPANPSESTSIESQAKSLVQQALSAYIKSAGNWSSQFGQSALAVAA
jgi:hypothetical protein